MLDEGSFSGAERDTDYYLVVEKVRERLAVRNMQHRSLMWKDLISGS
jgi:hypothetical protein